MKPPLLLRPLSESEQLALNWGLRSRDAFILRRCQIFKASSAGSKPAQIARVIGCATQTVRNAIHDFEQRGLAALTPQSSRPKTVQPIFDEIKRDQLKTRLTIANWLRFLFPTVAFLFSFPLHKRFLETALASDDPDVDQGACPYYDQSVKCSQLPSPHPLDGAH